jgi:hypothetical protein
MGSCHCYILNHCNNIDGISRQEQGKEVGMKFLLIVLLISFIAELLTSKRKTESKNETDERTGVKVHPAEFNLRWNE